MPTLTETREACKLTLESGRTGTRYQVERLPRKPGEYSKGFRLTGPAAAPVFAHELPCGLQECSCTAWTAGRECEHTRLLTAAGLFDEPVRPEDLDPAGYFQEDDLLDLDWESDAP